MELNWLWFLVYAKIDRWMEFSSNENHIANWEAQIDRMFNEKIWSVVVFTLHNCWPVDSSSNGCREKHLEQANKTTCELIVRFVAWMCNALKSAEYGWMLDVGGPSSIQTKWQLIIRRLLYNTSNCTAHSNRLAFSGNCLLDVLDLVEFFLSRQSVVSQSIVWNTNLFCNNYFFCLS